MLGFFLLDDSPVNSVKKTRQLSWKLFFFNKPKRWMIFDESANNLDFIKFSCTLAYLMIYVNLDLQPS